jgi:lipoprotein LprG
LWSEWVLAHDRARWARDGWASAESTLWDENGALVAYATQMMLFTYLPGRGLDGGPVGSAAVPGRHLIVAAGVAALLSSACTSSSTPKVDPQTLLHQAKATVDGAPSAHFTVTSQNVTGSGTNIIGGQGDLERPDALQGSFTVEINGFNAAVKVVSKGGVFEAQLPFQSKYTRTNPASFGLADPTQLTDPHRGLSNLLIIGTGAKSSGQERISGELLDEVTTTVPGSSIPVLPDANPSRPVALVAAINPKSSQVRQITLTGPFTSATSDSTFVVTLTKYGEAVTITLPG